MTRKSIKARFARGGSNKYLVSMLEEGLVDYILDGQTFDLDGVRSMAEIRGMCGPLLLPVTTTTGREILPSWWMW